MSPHQTRDRLQCAFYLDVGHFRARTLADSDRKEQWSLRTAADGTLVIEDKVSHQSFTVTRDAAGVWSLTAADQNSTTPKSK